MATTKQLLRQLRENCELRDAHQICRFVESIQILRESPSEAVLRGLLHSLRDTEAGGAQYELVEACEAYPIEQYVLVFLEEFPFVIAHSQEWSQLMLQSILNTPEAKEIFLNSFSTLQVETREQIVSTITSLTREYPQYTSVLNRLPGI